MTKSLLPPRGIFVSTRLIFHRRLPAALKDTAIQLMALTWANNSHCTPPLTYIQLAELTGKDPRTLRGHLHTLRIERVVLAQQYQEIGVFTLTMAGWLFRSDAVGAAEGSAQTEETRTGAACVGAACVGALREAPRRGPAQAGATGNEPGEGDATVQGSSEVTAAPQHAPAPKPPKRAKQAAEPTPLTTQTRAEEAPARRKPSAETAAPRVLSKSIQKELLAGGVFPTLLKEVAASPYSEADLRALLAWCRIDAPESAAGLFIGRMRAGAKAPRAYHGKPCDVCGLYGKHAPDCRRRFAQDIYVNG